MINFNDFKTVLAAANENIKEMQRQTKEVQAEISAINNDKYAPMKAFWKEVANIIEKSGLCHNTLYIDTPVCVDGKQCIVRVCLSSKETELAIHYRQKSEEELHWLQWCPITDCYDSLFHNNTYELVKAFIIEMINNWLVYEPLIAQSFKDAATKQMAERIHKEEEEYNAQINVLNELV